METLSKYIKAFKKLNLDRSHGIAPHKPILLISVLQAYQNKLITDNRIYLTPEIVALFKANWNSLVITKHECRISYPFYYLKSDKFWKLKPKPGFDNLEVMGSLVKNFANLNAAVEYAEIDEDLFQLMQNQDANKILLQFLLDEYFPTTKTNYYNSIDVSRDLFDELEGKILNESPSIYQTEIKKLLDEKDDEEIFIRGSLFKREIPKIYNNTCCISGMKVNATINISMIDACHIVPFSESYNDTVSNGIALCPNLHRAFDRGLISIDSEYRVLVSSTFIEDENNYSIRKFEGKSILLPRNNDYFPIKENFEWHRKNVFR